MSQAQQAPSGPVQRPAIQNGDASNRQAGGQTFFQFDFDTATPPRPYMERNLQQLPVQYQGGYVFAPEFNALVCSCCSSGSNYIVKEVEKGDGTVKDIVPVAASWHFVGVNVQPGHMMIDTGAQVVIIGSLAFDDLCSFCREEGYKEPYWLHRNESYTHGIGGQAKVIGEAKVPMGIGGAQGSMTMRVMEDGPLL